MSIPLYTIDFEGWSLPLSISYNATGIRTNEEAGEVGLGWALTATGVISRSINAGDDLSQITSQDGREGYVYDDKEVTTDMGFDPFGEYFPPPQSYYAHLARGADTQPDVFNYNFFGYNGSFVLQKKNDQGIIGVVRITTDACVIAYNEADTTFTVVTPQGFKGTFEAKEKSTTFSSSARTAFGNELYCCSIGLIDVLYHKNSSGLFRAITSWYLTKIESPRGKEINFNYDLNSGVKSPNVSLSKAFAEFPEPENERVCLQTVHEHVYLTGIVSDDIQVDFIMEFRDDLRANTLFNVVPSPGTSPYPQIFPVASKLKRYKEIRVDGIDPNSTLDKTITLTQNYFNQNYYNQYADTEDEVRYLRGRLDRIKINDQEYSFYYEKTGGLPDKLTTAVDHFGFYNAVEQFNLMLLPPYPLSGEGLLGSAIDGYDHADTVQYYRPNTSRMVDFSYGQAGLLKKVVYPTRGYSVFEYEPHRYMPDDSTPLREANVGGSAGNYGGGARIRSIKDYDFDGSLSLQKEYRYNEDPSNNFSASTGIMMTPLYNRYAVKNFLNVYPGPPVIYGINFKYRTHSAIPGSSSAQGKIIGYSKVHELVFGKNDSFRNTYLFENRKNKVSDFNATAGGYENLNGQVMEEKNYDERGKLVQHKINKSYYHKLGEVKGLAYEINGESGWEYLKWYAYYDIERTFIQPDTVIVITASTAGGVEEGSYQTTTSTTRNVYNDRGFLSRQITTNSTGEVVVTEYKRPTDYVGQSSALLRMNDPRINIVEPVIEEHAFRNEQRISAKANLYGLDPDTLVNLLSSYSWNPSLGSLPCCSDGGSFTSPYELKVTFNKYGPNGKLQEYTTFDGVKNALIWGYNNKLPIVHGVGIAHSLLDQAYNASLGANYETAIRSHANTAGKQITTFTHNPLVGILSVRNPNGVKKTFTYDSFQRLKSVLDNDGKTLEQYDFHLRERPEIKMLSMPGSIEFGSQTLDFFTETFLEYEKCGLSTRSVKIKNIGTDDVNVTFVQPPNGYEVDWGGGIIAAGSEIDLVIYFNRNSELTAGTYNGYLDVHAETGLHRIYLTGQLSARVCNLTPSETTLNFGQITGNSFRTKDLVLTNNGNGSLRVLGAAMQINGQPVPLNFRDFDVSLPTAAQCIDTESSQTFHVNFHPPMVNASQLVVDLVLATDVGCPNATVQLKGQRRPDNEAVMMSIPIQPLAQFETPSKEVFLHVSNPGVYQMNVTGISANVNDPKFTISPTVFDVNSGEEQIVTVTFSPNQFDFTQHDIIYTLASNKTSGNNVVALSAKRNSVRSVSVTPSPTIFNYYNQPQTLVIRNTGNDHVYFTDDGVSFSFPSPNGNGEHTTPTSSSVYYSAEIADVASVLEPDQPRNLTIRMIPGAPGQPLRQYINIDFTGAASEAYADVIPETRNISFISTNYTMSSHEDQTFTNALRVFNTGTSILTINDVQFSSGLFSKDSNAPFTVEAGGYVDVAIRYTAPAYDFSEHSGTIIFVGDMTSGGGNIVTVNAQRLIRRGLSFGPNPATFTHSFQNQSITITNTGNDYAYLTGFTYSFPNGGTFSSSEDWNASLTIPSGSIAPGSTRTMTVLPKKTSPVTQIINVMFNSASSTSSDATAGFTVNAQTKVLSYPISTVVLNTSNVNPLTGNFTIYNTGNTAFEITSYTSTNGNFSISNLPVTVNGGGNAVVNVVYDANTFATQTTDIELSGNFNEFEGPLKVTIQAQWEELVHFIKLPFDNWSLTFSQQTLTNSFKNDGNVPIKIRSVSFDNSPVEFALDFQIGSTWYTTTQLLSALPTIPADALINVKLSSTVGFPNNGGGNTFRLAYSRVSDNTIVDTIPIIVARQGHQ